MSYTRTHTATIHGTAHGRFSYPASKNGGTTSVSIPWSEIINTTILVDTNPFDHGVDQLKHHVDVLTGSVVATEAAQVLQKSQNADKISKSVSAGFFNLIHSEITQQSAALKNRVQS